MAKKMTEFEVLLEMAAKLDPSYRTAMENARRGVKDVGDGAEDGADGIGIMDIAIGNLIADGISSLISWTGEAARSLYGLAEETRELRQDMGTLETAFSEVGLSTETATDYWKDLYAVIGEDDRAVETANNISRMADTEEELADWLTITTGIWGSYQDALPVESLAETAAETAKVGKVTGSFADALNWGAQEGETFGVSLKRNTKANKEWNKAVKAATSAEDFFNLALQECSTEAERQALINETLLKMYGDAATQYEETAGSVMDANAATAEYTLTQAKMGEKLEPVTTAVTTGLNKLATAGMGLIEDVDFTEWASRIETAFSWIVNTGLPFIVDKAIPFFIKNLPILGVAVAGIGAALIAYNFSSIVTGVTTAVKGLWATFTASPVGMIILGITALVTAFMYLWNNCEGFRNFWINLWAGIKNAAGAVATWFTGTFVPWISGVWAQISGPIQVWYETILKPIVDSIIGIFQGIIDFIVGVFTGNWQMAWQGVVDIFGGIFGLLEGLVKAPINAVIRLLNWFIGKINTISIGPLPNWGILGEYAGASIGFNIPTIPALAQGGIVTAPTLAMVGEGAESEAVLPLSKLGALMGENAETVSIIFSPNITVMPGANGADVQTAVEQSFEQFKRFMDRYLRERKRVSFA